MKFVCMNILCLVILINFGSAFVPKTNTAENIEDLRYPKPLNISSIFPFRVLRTIFNMTSIDQSLERGSNRITSQVSAVVDVLRRVFRYMLRNAFGVSPLRTNLNIANTTQTNVVVNDSNVSVDLPTFSVVNDEDLVDSKNKTDDSINKI